MPAVSRKITFIKLTIVSFTAIFAVFCFQKFFVQSGKVSASAFGPSASFTNAPGEANCTACHTDFAANSGTGSVTIGTLPASYTPNQVISITVTTSQADAVIYGFQMTALDSQNNRAGDFILPTQNPAQMLIMTGLVNNNVREYIEHTVDGVIPTAFGSKSWTFTWRAPSQGVGTIRFYVAGNAANSDGGTSGDYVYTATKSISDGSQPTRSVISDFDGDRKSDVAVFRPSNGTWYSLNSSNGNFVAAGFGANGDRVVSADYDGDRKSDYAVFRPSNGTWYLNRSTAGFTGVAFGASGDEPAIGDYDGDGKSDIAVFRPSSGFWYILQSSNGAVVSTLFGQASDKIAQGDYDGDGKTDIGVFRAGVWYLQRSTAGFTGIAFGAATDKPVQSDFDGDGKTDIAVYRGGTWYMQRSTAGFTGATFGAATDRPIPADYDGDGKADIAVFRPSDGAWYILRSTNGTFYGVIFGASTDIPVPSGYLAQ